MLSSKYLRVDTQKEHEERDGGGYEKARFSTGEFQLQASTVFCQDGHDYIPRAEWKREARKAREPGRRTGSDNKKDDRERWRRL